MVTAIAIESRGALTLRSPSPYAKPLIDPAYLTDKADLDILVASSGRPARSPRPAPASLVGGEWAPGEQADPDEAIVDFIRREVATLFHPTSTCAMGADDSVCDPSLRVRGVEACASWTPRSCRPSRAATPTPPPSRSPNGPPT